MVPITAKAAVVDCEMNAPVLRGNEFVNDVSSRGGQVYGYCFEFQAVETNQAVLCAEPQIAVSVLRDGAYSVGRQAILARPVPAIKLVQAFAGIERPRTRNAKNSQGRDNDPISAAK